jgi:hypothetical protein
VAQFFTNAPGSLVLKTNLSQGPFSFAQKKILRLVAEIAPRQL